MKRPSIWLWNWIVVGLLAVAGCSRERSVEALLGDADASHQAREFEKAKLQYLKVLQKEPKNPRSIAQVGKILYLQGQLEEAYPFLNEARKLQPDDIEVAANLATLYLGSGTPDGVEQARTLARFVLEKDPAHEAALAALVESARSAADLDQVASEIDALERRAGAKPSLHMARGMVFARKRDRAGAESELHKALALNPNSVVALVSLGQIHWQAGKTNEAVEVMQKARAAAVPSDPATFQLAGLLLRMGKTADAAAVLETITSQAPERTAAWVMRAEMAKAEGKLDECAKLLERALGQAPNDLAGRLVQAQLRLAQKKPAEAVGILKRVIERRPRASEAHYQLGLAHVASQELNEALAAFAQVESINTNDLRAPLVRAEILLNRGEPAPATEILQDLVRRQPALMPAQLLLARAYVTQARYDQAIALFRGLNERYPRNPAILFRLGLILSQRGGQAEARKLFEQVLSLAPSDLGSVEQLVELDLSEKNPRAAGERLKPVLERDPKLARMWMLQSRVLMAEQRWDDAEKALDKALELEPGAQTAYMMLADLNLKRGNPERSLKRLADLLEKDPKNTGARILQGMIQEQTGAHAEARKTYEELIRVQPDSVVALNNLAYLLSEHLHLPEEAHPHAAAAVRLAPEDAYVADTLGWVEYRRGNYPEAVRLLTRAHDKLTGQVEVAAHLGLAAYMVGDEELARRALSVALKGDTAFPARKQAEESLAVLNLGDGQGSPAVLEALERRRRENPKDVIALVRLGVAHEASGQVDKARETFQAALKLSPAAPDVLRRLAALEVDRDPAAARDLARRAQQALPDDPLVNRTLGRLALASGDGSTAYGLLTRAARQMTNVPALWMEVARAAFAVGKLTESEEAARRLVSVGTATPTSLAAQTWVQLLVAAKVPVAEQSAAVEGILQKEPELGPALHALALIRERQGRHADARDLYEKLIQRVPGFPPAIRNLTVLYGDRLQQDDKAWALATQARTAFPNDVPLARSIAALAFRREDYRYAIQLYGDLTRSQPKDGGIQFQLGLCHLRLKQNGEARTALNKALTLEPAGPFAAEARKLLEELDKG